MYEFRGDGQSIVLTTADTKVTPTTHVRTGTAAMASQALRPNLTRERTASARVDAESRLKTLFIQ